MDCETCRWGKTEIEPLPALRITDLTEREADLIEAFVPVAVDEAGGFAGFREMATKTNSLVDRLRTLTLPAVDDVRNGLESYVETMERAEELETKIERTDDLIDEIYGPRAVVESVFAAIKPRFGETLRAKSLFGPFRELVLKAAVFNVSSVLSHYNG